MKVKKGWLAVHVGAEEDEGNNKGSERFVIPISYLYHPLLQSVLEKAREVYGYMLELDEDDEDSDLGLGAGFLGRSEEKKKSNGVDFIVTTRSRKQRRLVYIGKDLRENDERRPQQRRRKRNRRLGFKKLILTISWEYQTGTEFLQQPGTEHYTLAEYKVYDAGRQTLNSLQNQLQRTRTWKEKSGYM
nr:auxin-induced protein 6B-like [Ipomoea batatas]